ncbi:hypothetical protein JB92DRAFT_2741190 [Gautieria morchelliformis]|nr:hypothetical protein JB92DRAFT_2741190 [Gautieria morchelliformis]
MAIIPTLVNRNPFRLLTSLFAFALVASEVHVASARPCIAFDANFNLFAFGFGGKDFQLGTQDKWSSTSLTFSSAVSPTDVTSTGRPPFDGPQTTCYLAQFFNAIYVLNGDNSNPSAVHIFNAKSNSWSTQAVNSGGPDPTSLVAILDHDTNVFYALASGTMSSLDLGTQTQATGSSLSWNNIGNPSFTTTNYNPTMALAQNHIHFVGVPNSQPGTADIFVIHFSFFQPTPQSYPVQGGGNSFPSTHGQTASYFLDSGVQQEFAFIPDDGNATYIINVEGNTTLPVAGPSDKSSSTYAASTQALVQLTSAGSLSFLPYTPGNNATNMAATWSKITVQGLPAVSTSNSSTNSTAASGSGSGTATASAASSTGTTSSGKNSNGELSLRFGSVVTTLAGVTMAIALVLL